MNSLLGRMHAHTKLLGECSALEDAAQELRQQASKLLYHSHIENIQDYVRAKGIEATSIPTPDTTSVEQQALFMDMEASLYRTKELYTSVARLVKLLQTEE